jgi:hypothetical protein
VIIDSDKGRSIGDFRSILDYVKKVKPKTAMVYDTFEEPRTADTKLCCVGVDFTGDFAADLADAADRLWKKFEKHYLTD